ncbi:MAG: hypothetical protein ACYDD1_08765, partial [Caulobacteraceae bacterium]
MSKLRHRLARALVILSVPAALAACATTEPVLRTAQAAPDPLAASDPPRDDASVYGLFLAGE